LALAAVTLAAAGCRSRRASRERGPLLRVGPLTPGEPDGVAAWRGLALAMRALPEERRAELGQEASQWLDDMEARHHPLVVDLTEGSSPPLERIRGWFLPIWNAACALDVRRWRLPSRELEVAIASTRNVRAFRAWEDGADRDSLIVAARFAAWPVTSARLVDARTPEQMARFESALRKRLCDPDSCLALFVDRTSLDRTEPCADFDAVRKLAERARRFARAAPSEIDPELRSLLEHLPPVEPPTTLTSWLDLRACEVLVVPRLGALARRAEFDAELRTLRFGAGLTG
jgi:hypothetical protein